MVRLGTFAIFLFLVGVFSPFAKADDIADARLSLSSGNYGEAFEKASLIGNTEAQLLSAEALNTRILLGQSPNVKDDAKHAMRIAKDILAIEPDNNQAKLLYAIAYGFYGRTVSPLKAWRKKIPKKIETAILEAVETNPENANSFALYAGWHMAVCAKAGPKRAQRMYGASVIDGIANFEKARSLLPNDLMINANYALMLFATDAELYDPKISQLALTITEAVPNNSAESFVQTLVKDIIENREFPKKAHDAAEEFLGW
jgi:hypothetical protein